MPYCIVASKDELFNYLLCAEMITTENGEKKQKVSTYRLNRLNDISISSKRFNIDPVVASNIIKTMQYNPKFAINNAMEATVKLTSRGLQKLQRIYQDRPRNIQLEKSDEFNFFKFDGSADQLELYLKKLGSDAVVMEPEYLKNRLKNFYKDSFLAYNKGGNDNEL